MTPRLFAALFVLPLLAPSVACDTPNEPPLVEGCSSSRQCLYGEVCNPISRACLSEPKGGLQGQFYCIKVANGVENVRDEGSFSEVVGRVNLPDPKGGRSLQRMNLIAPAQCGILDGNLYVQLADTAMILRGEGYLAYLNVPLGKLQVNSLADLTDPEKYSAYAFRGTMQQSMAGDIFTQSADRQFKISVDRFPQAGQPLQGYIDVTFDDITPAPAP